MALFDRRVRRASASTRRSVERKSLMLNGLLFRADFRRSTLRVRMAKKFDMDQVVGQALAGFRGLVASGRATAGRAAPAPLRAGGTPL